MLDLSSIKQIPSPNFGLRGSNKPQIIVLHCPVGTLQGCIATFQNPLSKVSAHYVIDRTGQIVQMVALENAAWHAMHYPNIIGIGIEMVDKYLVGGYVTRGCMADPQWATAEQMNAVAELVATLMKQFNIALDKVMGHNDQWLRQFGNNHQDPGPYFPWNSFRALVSKFLSASPPEPPAVESSAIAKLEIPLTAPQVAFKKPRKKRGRRLIKPPKKNRIYE